LLALQESFSGCILKKLGNLSVNYLVFCVWNKWEILTYWICLKTVKCVQLDETILSRINDQMDSLLVGEEGYAY